mmetsp:Transcript_12866/g.26111  ORF Transcript_12866/g.26111 Transcript_12866/m.26111 type:complete len:102 (+) Transcript_12866:1379-1684(+)
MGTMAKSQYRHRRRQKGMCTYKPIDDAGDEESSSVEDANKWLPGFVVLDSKREKLLTWFVENRVHQATSSSARTRRLSLLRLPKKMVAMTKHHRQHEWVVV